MSLEKLFTKTHEVKYNDVTITIKDLTLVEAPFVARLISQISGKDKKDIATAVGDNISDVKEVICSLTNITKDIIDQVAIDAIIFIMAKIIKLNITFLKKTILPMAKEIEMEMSMDGSKPPKS